ncbi:MAG: AsmA-like C-terminal region-containing protein [Kiritimatiellae bacterium]|nr:AsmA-like C-terminal region-containing protein [Kiritimatiellia bacterium]
MKFFRIFFGTMKWVFIVFCVLIASLSIWDLKLPGRLVVDTINNFAPHGLKFECRAASFNLLSGLSLKDISIFDETSRRSSEVLMSAKSVKINPFSRIVRVDAPKYTRLPDSYYYEASTEVSRVKEDFEFDFPNLPVFRLIMTNADILGIQAELVEGLVGIHEREFSVKQIELQWPDFDPAKNMHGFCWVNLDKRRVYGEVRGYATVEKIRPLIVCLDVPVALPYMDGFTEIPEPVDAFCSWDVNLMNNDFTLKLDLNPKMGKYNGVAMSEAHGKIELKTHIHDGDKFKYMTKIHDVRASGENGRDLQGLVMFEGDDGMVKATVKANSTLPLQEILDIGGLDIKVGDRTGKTSGDFTLSFPRGAQDATKYNGGGHFEVKDGQLAQMPLFMGLTQFLSEKVPGVSYIVDQNHASFDFKIEDGMFTSDNIVIEGDLFTINLAGSYDMVKDNLDVNVQVNIVKDDGLLKKYLIRPITWVFTKLLMEFRLTGSLDNPEWEYVSVIDRVWDGGK